MRLLHFASEMLGVGVCVTSLSWLNSVADLSDRLHKDVLLRPLVFAQLIWSSDWACVMGIGSMLQELQQRALLRSVKIRCNLYNDGHCYQLSHFMSDAAPKDISAS